MKQHLDLKVDLENPDEARHTIDELVKMYEEDKLKWTEEEIAEAKRLAMEIMERLCLDGYSINWNNLGEYAGFITIHVLLTPEEGEYFGKTCTMACDKWNLWIAKCYCLCKATGKDVPAFIITKKGRWV